jgi:aspartate racemase
MVRAAIGHPVTCGVIGSGFATYVIVKHIGIVGCSAEGAALCYRTICVEGAQRLGGHAHPQISMHTHSLADYVDCLERGDLKGVGDLVLSSTLKLQASGSDFLICPDNTIHQAMDHVLPHSPLPWLHIVEVAAAETVARGHRRVGLLGTRWLLESELYPRKLAAVGLDCVRPGPRERDQVNQIIMSELAHGAFDPASVKRLEEVIAGFKEKGCDAAMLGCTEIPLVISDANSALPTLDSTRLLARAALDRAQGLAHRGSPSCDRPASGPRACTRGNEDAAHEHPSARSIAADRIAFDPATWGAAP